MTELELLYFEDLEEVDFLKVQKFINMTDEQVRQIQPIWAVGEHAHLAIDLSTKMAPEKYMTTYINPQMLIENAYALILPTDTLFTGDLNDCRYATTLELWVEGKPVDPPSISFQGNSRRKLSISDGRHRSVLSYYLGVERIPITIHKADYENLKEFLCTE